ncbi:hypothetical protein XAP6164_70003 [Xanthomonas phaseoli pv. phaseoli]|nr:hypothetical protein XAP6164_70003 [Xanthomonas phaseoli pv. phaseoli]
MCSFGFSNFISSYYCLGSRLSARAVSNWWAGSYRMRSDSPRKLRTDDTCTSSARKMDQNLGSYSNGVCRLYF